MRVHALLAVALLCSCASPAPAPRFAQAQRLVDRLVAEHPRVSRLTIHAVPTGEPHNRILACNLREKLGQISDPEDLRVMTTHEAVVLREGGDLDVTLPILDESGQAIAAAGITLASAGSEGDDALVQEAASIARELTDAIRAAKRPLW